MSSRHLARQIAMQTLFEIDFTGAAAASVDDIIKHNVEEHAPELSGDFSFVTELVKNTLSKLKDLDNIIAKGAPEWPLEKISTVDRNILRLGLYELLFSDRSKVPAKVAINEAIELAKRFGGDSSGRFVNGVLGAVYKEIGEPGKDEVTKKKKSVKFEDMPIERLGGAIVYARDGEEVYLALVHDVFGHWTLSKGHFVEGEEEKDAIKRVIKDEIGLDASEVRDKLGNNEYVASQPEKGKIRKQVVYYLVEAPYEELQLKTTGGLDDAQWFKLADILRLNFYEDILQIVTKAVNILLQKDTPKET